MPTELQLACDNLRYDIRRCRLSGVEIDNMLRRVRQIETLAAEQMEGKE